MTIFKHHYPVKCSVLWLKLAVDSGGEENAGGGGTGRQDASRTNGELGILPDGLGRSKSMADVEQCNRR